MNRTIEKLLQGQEDNHILPFFWQHGEDEATLRKMMQVIHQANCGAVCIESRPHPQFCGAKWWQDMDVILDEARKRNMKVWILDDSHFPTGFANDGLKGKPDSLCRQNIFLKEKVYTGKAGQKKICLRKHGFFKQEKEGAKGPVSFFFSMMPPARKFNDDSILCLTARQREKTIDLTHQCKDGVLLWDKPEGDWTLSAVIRSRNTGSHRNYINMTDPESCQVLIDSVYEPHWQHYAADFGKTIVGFFSDEPELGNGGMYAKDNFLGTQQDLPWSVSVEKAMVQALGENWQSKIHLLWQDGPEAPHVRQVYMDIVTKSVRSAFSKPIADWCHAHGVQYIGHVIEDDGQHTRTGSSLGHYFRGLQYQDMSGIDDIGGQVYPQGEDEPKINFMRQPRNGEFFHYGLAKLAQSAAAIEPRKQGNAMCEIFGNYGWEEGVRLEKYLADHFLVRGINYYVPHAFTGKAYPDMDCPPHFYAQGHNPQYRHFGMLMKYMNRVATLTSSGKHHAPLAILYHAESEWADNQAMPFETPLRALYDHQLDCHTLPADIFTEPEHYDVTLGNPLVVNGQKYEAFIIPATCYLPASAVEGLAKLAEMGLPVIFVERRPEDLPKVLQNCPCVPLAKLYDEVCSLSICAPVCHPASDRVRLLHIHGDTEMFMVVNEAASVYEGTLQLPVSGDCYGYDAWDNVCFNLPLENGAVRVKLEPLHSLFIVFGDCAEKIALPEYSGEKQSLENWRRSYCPGIQYPGFGPTKQVTLPDNVALEDPKFSGFIRYETTIRTDKDQRMLLQITDAYEGVEVFLNGKSLGLQIAPPMRYTLDCKEGGNTLAIEVATTLERQSYPLLKGFRKMLASKPSNPTGLTGKVYLFQK